MSFEVKTIQVFERQAKRLIKKYPSLRTEIIELVMQLKTKTRKRNTYRESMFQNPVGDSF